jgi:hypothetical protein
MKAVQDRALVEEIALGRVDVLPAQRVVLPELPRLEAHDATPRVRKREHETPREVVAPAHGHEPGSAQLVLREPTLARLLGKPATGRQPEPELLRDLLAEPAAGQVLANGRSPLSLPEQALEEGRRLLEKRVEALPSPPVGIDAGRDLLVLERDAEPLG